MASMSSSEPAIGTVTVRAPALMIVAHPDDETLWAGGLMLMNPAARWTVLCLCRASDADRAPRFAHAMDHGPEQEPLPPKLVRDAVTELLPARAFPLVVTHSPRGEYSRHRRHEEVGRAVAFLWRHGALKADALWEFAYDDGGRRHLPRATPGAHRTIHLPAGVAEEKGRIIREVYGFPDGSFEARTTPTTEAFWCFDSPAAYERRRRGEGDAI
jgi:LmbE family N-acetylglucosaminyl deacetylase